MYVYTAEKEVKEEKEEERRKCERNLERERERGKREGGQPLPPVEDDEEREKTRRSRGVVAYEKRKERGTRRMERRRKRERGEREKKRENETQREGEKEETEVWESLHALTSTSLRVITRSEGSRVSCVHALLSYHRTPLAAAPEVSTRA